MSVYVASSGTSDRAPVVINPASGRLLNVVELTGNGNEYLQGELSILPVLLDRTKFDAMCFNVSSAATSVGGQEMRVGLYRIDPITVQATLIIDAGAASLTSTGIKVLPHATQDVLAGLYGLAFLPQGAATVNAQTGRGRAYYRPRITAPSTANQTAGEPHYFVSSPTNGGNLGTPLPTSVTLNAMTDFVSFVRIGMRLA